MKLNEIKTGDRLLFTIKIFTIKIFTSIPLITRKIVEN